jgi:branched-chain amino acid transport system ATP-binding protein
VAGGLTEPEVAQLVTLVREINASGVTIIWIEHVVRALLSTVDRLVCLALGRLIADGDPIQVLGRADVKELFLGTDSTVIDPLAADGGP